MLFVERHKITLPTLQICFFYLKLKVNNKNELSLQFFCNIQSRNIDVLQEPIFSIDDCNINETKLIAVMH